MVIISAASPHIQPVHAENYQNFWIWGHVRTDRVSSYAHRLYILQGRIGYTHQKQLTFQPQGIFPKILDIPIFLVYRFETLAWNTWIKHSIVNQIRWWETKGQPIIGIQIDFDAATRQLHHYEQFLRQVRADLPAHYQLSVTGLLDWSQQGNPLVLQHLADVLDEIIFQTYQGRYTIPHYSDYLSSLLHLRIPFQIGIIEHGIWNPAYEILLKQSIYYRGITVFLLPTTPS